MTWGRRYYCEDAVTKHQQRQQFKNNTKMGGTILSEPAPRQLLRHNFRGPCSRDSGEVAAASFSEVTRVTDDLGPGTNRGSYPRWDQASF